MDHGYSGLTPKMVDEWIEMPFGGRLTWTAQRTTCYEGVVVQVQITHSMGHFGGT